VAGDFKKSLVGCRKNLPRFGPDLFLEGLKRFPASVVVSEVGNVLPQDHFPRATQPRHLRLAVVCLKLLKDLCQWDSRHGPLPLAKKKSTSWRRLRQTTRRSRQAQQGSALSALPEGDQVARNRAS
jgi:hypothetical protein